MNTQEVANALVKYCREGNYEQVYKELYSPNIVSIEPKGAPVEVVEGIEGILEKGKQFNEMIEEFVSSEISEPIVAENFFSITMKMKAKFKGAPKVTDMDEVCVYEVKEGKVVKEQFFYTPEPQQ